MPRVANKKQQRVLYNDGDDNERGDDKESTEGWRKGRHKRTNEGLNSALFDLRLRAVIPPAAT